MNITLAISIATVALMSALSLLNNVSSKLRTINAVQEGNNVANAETSAIDYIRAEYQSVIRLQGLDTVGLQSGLRKAIDATGEPWAEYLVNWHSSPDLPRLEVRTVALSEDRVGTHLAKVQVRYYDTLAHSKEVLTREYQLNLGTQSVFSNAITGENFWDEFMHVSIFGDVAEYHDSKGTRHYNDRIHGTWYALGDLVDPHDPWTPLHADILSERNPSQKYNPNHPLLPIADPKIYPDFVGDAPMSCPGLPWPGGVDKCANDFGILYDPHGPLALPAPENTGGGFLAIRDTKYGYAGPKLPWNFQRQRYIPPKFEPTPMLYLAQGSVSTSATASDPEAIHVVPYGGVYANVSTQKTTIVNKIVEGNLILKGTTAHPIQLSGRVFVRGDVVISGVVRGRGAIYAGRNIYIVDDITYETPPPEADNSEASNEKMTLISYGKVSGTGNPCDVGTPNCIPNAKTMVDGWNANGGYDQLFLFAANNVIVSDPFNDDVEIVEGQSGNELSSWHSNYVNWTLLWQNKDELAQDLVQGYMLDAEVDSDPDVDPHFYFPWSRKEVASAMVKKRAGAQYADPESAPTDRDWNLAWTGMSSNEARTHLFEPRNTKYDTTLAKWTNVSWITKEQFREVTRNAAEQAAVLHADPSGLGRKSRYKSFQLPLFSESPWNANRWQFNYETPSVSSHPKDRSGPDVKMLSEGALRTIDRLTGALQTARDANGNPLKVYVNAAGTNAVTLEQAIVDYLQKVKAYRLRTPENVITPHHRNHSDYVDLTRDQDGWPWLPYKQWSRFKYGFDYNENWNLAPLAVADTFTSGISGDFYYDADYCWNGDANHKCDCLAPGKFCGRVTARLWYESPWGFSATGICDDVEDMKYDWLTMCVGNWATCYKPATCENTNRPCNLEPYVPNQQSVTCQTNLTAANRSFDEREQADDDFHIGFWSGMLWAESYFHMKSRYWDEAKTPPRNRIKNIHAYLFANHYVVYAPDSDSGTDINIFGGIVSKDVAGHFNNSFSPDEPYSKFYFDRHKYEFPPLANYTLPDWKSSLPGLRIVLDPRAQFDIDLVYSDFGMLMMTGF